MVDAKKINAIVSDIASRGGASNKSATPGDFSRRMTEAKKTKRSVSVPSRASSNAAPSPVNVEKGYKKTEVKQAATNVPAPSKGKKGPTMQTGAGKKGGHTFNISITNK